MKKSIFLFVCVLAMPFLSAQDLTDIVRYSQQEIRGTARFRGMSGAFGALGGDLSALHINPAGSAVFLNSYGSVTLSSTLVDNEVNYFNEINVNTSRHLNFNQLGAVFVYDGNPDSSGINKVSFGVTYDQTADNRDLFRAIGRSNSSIDRFFLAEAQGIPLDLITVANGETIDGVYRFLGENEGYGVQQAFLGHESFLIEADDLDDPNNTSYFSNIASGSFDQDYIFESSGINGKLTFNGGVQFDEDFYVGANLNSHFINYDRVTDYFEGNNNSGSTINEVNFVNRLSVTGAGFSAQIGGIAKVSEMLRLGLSLETPTWYIMQEETTQLLETFSDEDGRSLVDPEIINVFPEYELTTPGKITASAAILFGKSGLISLDYSYKDYASTKLSSNFNIDFSAQNSVIENNLQGASSIRLGGEYRTGNWSYRAGYLYDQSPYQNEAILGERTGISVGFGYNFGKLRFDFAYDSLFQERSQQLFPASGFTNAARIDNFTDNLTFTLGLNL